MVARAGLPRRAHGLEARIPSIGGEQDVMLSVITINIDPVAFQVGPISVHWYGVMYAVAFAAGFYFGVLPYLVPRGINKQYCERALFTVIIFGLLGGRLYYVVQQPDLGFYLHNPV